MSTRSSSEPRLFPILAISLFGVVDAPLVFEEFGSEILRRRVDYSNIVHKLTCGKRESVSMQHSMKNRRAVGLLNPVRHKIEGKNRGEEGMTPVTTACAEAGK